MTELSRAIELLSSAYNNTINPIARNLIEKSMGFAIKAEDLEGEKRDERTNRKTR